MAGECREAMPAEQLGDHSYFEYLVVDDVDTIIAACRRRQTEVVKPVRDEPWGMREFGLRTADGYRIMLGSRTGMRSREE